MFKSIIYLAFFIFSTNGVDCSTRISTNCESDVQCKWQQGNGQCLKLDSTDCTTTGYCAQGCTVTPAVFATCSDPKIATCSSETTAETCPANDCTWSTGACVPTGGCQYWGSECDSKPGCFFNFSHKCEGIPDDVRSCSKFGIDSVTECELAEGCRKSGTSCIGDGEDGDAFCQYFSATRPASECSSAGEEIIYCKVEGSSCVLNSGLYDEIFPEVDQSFRSLVTEWCATLKTTAATACEIYDCKISGTECTNKTPDEICNKYSIALTVSECSNGFDECCAVNGANCITKPGLTPDEAEWCRDANCSTRSTTITGSQCSDNYPCVVTGEQCVRDNFDCTIGVKADGSCTAEAYSHGCSTATTQECVSKDCGVFTSEEDCELGCGWDGAISNCVPQTPLNCVLDDETGCDTTSSVSCASSSFVPPACSVPLIVESTCTAQTSNTGCEGTNGCKWRTAGGSCVAADTGPSGDGDDSSTGGDDDDDNSTGGDDDSNASIICSHFVFMIFVILLLL